MARESVELELSLSVPCVGGIKKEAKWLDPLHVRTFSCDADRTERRTPRTHLRARAASPEPDASCG